MSCFQKGFGCAEFVDAACAVVGKESLGELIGAVRMAPVFVKSPGFAHIYGHRLQRNVKGSSANGFNTLNCTSSHSICPLEKTVDEFCFLVS
jgi:hypothetical protein